MIELSLASAAPVVPGDQPRSLAADELHVWRWTTGDLDEAWLEQLDDNERDRHRRFLTLELQERFLAAHGGQRQVLASYLECTSSEVCFDYEPKGKPFVPGRPLEFNLSHSSDVNVLVVSQQPVGIDAECKRPISDIQGLAGKHFTAKEQSTVGPQEDDAALGAFLQIWTRKEAIVKVTGLGLGGSVRLLDVHAVSRDFSKFELPQQWETDLEVCWLTDLAVSNECYGAVATVSKPSGVCCFTLAGR